MDNYKDGSVEILSQVVQARYLLENEMLFKKKYPGERPEGCIIENIAYSEAENIRFKTAFKSESIAIHYEFAIVCIYGLYNYNSGIRSYDVISDMARGTLSIDKYNFYPFSDFSEETGCCCRPREVKCNCDIDIDGKGITVCVSSAIDILLLKEDVLRIESGVPAARDKAQYERGGEVSDRLHTAQDIEWTDRQREINNLEARVHDYIHEIAYLKDANKNLYLQLKDMEEENKSLRCKKDMEKLA
ncbi:hypothetical protein DFR58_1286 [Anaerobacterium chartisolvens]|uniref:Uncharacterized protein n=1 Tax=Anaerobacterium chartisolvens TaxID=1297424 RepID=A0A369AQK6_9FIRM|nr:hypothetical protein [Anaerobacterium chartisolvens]RCX10507.1 hypothetical protein DFR58_1286 [Anaerobacterium chartisolvens]